jgi:hypothetical protein
MTDRLYCSDCLRRCETFETFEPVRYPGEPYRGKLSGCCGEPVLTGPQMVEEWKRRRKNREDMERKIYGNTTGL